MPLQEFWNEDPDLLWTYRTSYLEKEKQKIEIQKEMINFQAWLQGLYNYNAIGSVFSKNGKYLSQPLELNEKPKNKKEEKLAIAQRIKERTMQGKAILQQRSENKER